MLGALKDVFHLKKYVQPQNHLKREHRNPARTSSWACYSHSKLLGKKKPTQNNLMSKCLS